MIPWEFLAGVVIGVLLRRIVRPVGVRRLGVRIEVGSADVAAALRRVARPDR